MILDFGMPLLNHSWVDQPWIYLILHVVPIFSWTTCPFCFVSKEPGLVINIMGWSPRQVMVLVRIPKKLTVHWITLKPCNKPFWGSKLPVLWIYFGIYFYFKPLGPSGFVGKMCPGYMTESQQKDISQRPLCWLVTMFMYTNWKGVLFIR